MLEEELRGRCEHCIALQIHLALLEIEEEVSEADRRLTFEGQSEYFVFHIEIEVFLSANQSSSGRIDIYSKRKDGAIFWIQWIWWLWWWKR